MSEEQLKMNEVLKEIMKQALKLNGKEYQNYVDNVYSQLTNKEIRILENLRDKTFENLKLIRNINNLN